MELSEIEETLSKGIFNQFKVTFDIIEELIESKGEKDKENNDGENKEDMENEENENELNSKERGNERPKPQKSSEIEFIDEEKIKLAKKLKEEEADKEEIKRLKEELIDEIYLNLKILSLKTSQAMNVLDKDGKELQSLFFPSTMYNFLIRDIGLNMIGMIDKIEVEKGKYYPVLMKTSKPPVRGVWDGDRLEIIANALLIESEFNTHITVGFVDYLKINERRPVVIDTITRRNFFKTLTKINRIVERGEIPSVNANLNKCVNCEYNELCENS